MSGFIYLFLFTTIVGCTQNETVLKIKNSTQTTTKQAITFSDIDRPVFFYGDNIGGHPSGRPDFANPAPFILWMQVQTGTEKICDTPMFETGYPGEATYFDKRLLENIEIGHCSNLPGRCFLISDKWYKGNMQARLDEAESCNPALSDKKTRKFSAQ